MPPLELLSYNPFPLPVPFPLLFSFLRFLFSLTYIDFTSVAPVFPYVLSRHTLVPIFEHSADLGTQTHDRLGHHPPSCRCKKLHATKYLELQQTSTNPLLPHHSPTSHPTSWDGRARRINAAASETDPCLLSLTAVCPSVDCFARLGALLDSGLLASVVLRTSYTKTRRSWI